MILNLKVELVLMGFVLIVMMPCREPVFLRAMPLAVIWTSLG